MVSHHERVKWHGWRASDCQANCIRIEEAAIPLSLSPYSVNWWVRCVRSTEDGDGSASWCIMLCTESTRWSIDHLIFLTQYQFHTIVNAKLLNQTVPVEVTILFIFIPTLFFPLLLRLTLSNCSKCILNDAYSLHFIHITLLFVQHFFSFPSSYHS